MRRDASVLATGALLGSLFFAALALVACPAPEPFRPVTPAALDAGPLDAPAPVAGCAAACARLAALGCAAAAPTPRGEPCVAVCAVVASSDVARWDTGCVARAASCSDADACALVVP